MITDNALALKVAMQGGNLAALTPDELDKWYLATCEAAGLDPMTTPFVVIREENKSTGEVTVNLAPVKAACAALAKKHNLSRTITRSEAVIVGSESLWIVHVRQTDPNGRCVEDAGCVALTNKYGKLTGKYLQNAIMTAITKASSRAILGYCGLGQNSTDELEVEEPEKPAEQEQHKPEPKRAPAVTPPKEPVEKKEPEKPKAEKPAEKNPGGLTRDELILRNSVTEKCANLQGDKKTEARTRYRNAKTTDDLLALEQWAIEALKKKEPAKPEPEKSAKPEPEKPTKSEAESIAEQHDASTAIVKLSEYLVMDQEWLESVLKAAGVAAPVWSNGLPNGADNAALKRAMDAMLELSRGNVPDKVGDKSPMDDLHDAVLELKGKRRLGGREFTQEELFLATSWVKNAVGGTDGKLTMRQWHQAWDQVNREVNEAARRGGEE